MLTLSETVSVRAFLLRHIQQSVLQDPGEVNVMGFPVQRVYEALMRRLSTT